MIVPKGCSAVERRTVIFSGSLSSILLESHASDLGSTPYAFHTSSCRSSNRLAPSPTFIELMPVRFPPGRPRLVTSHASTASAAIDGCEPPLAWSPSSSREPMRLALGHLICGRERADRLVPPIKMNSVELSTSVAAPARPRADPKPRRRGAGAGSAGVVPDDLPPAIHRASPGTPSVRELESLQRLASAEPASPVVPELVE